jgi:hypothetical protein
MNKKLSLLWLDFYLLKSYTWYFIFLIGIAAAFGVVTKAPNYFSSFMVMMMMLAGSYPFIYGEQYGLDTLYATLPLNRKTVVTGHYLFASVMALVSGLLVLLGSWVLSLALGLEYLLKNELANTLILVAAFAFVVALQFPLYFRLGYMKARFIAVIPMIIVFGAIIALPAVLAILSNNNEFKMDFLYSGLLGSRALLLLPVLFAVLALALSWRVSCRIYKKRDL